ncbi:hypothetical protein M885DRAFT_509779 [Pelagophyceae sp. CCMP2097]|nr:hypothetical protein M885DRAFT_509779 [Pelagophyceae sp. CCMP2097]|mmetsp:Transcript_16872/g.57056  ORF Transcript_16872/g.57056 Transcript_16872/m.57056 type:complete len:110 (-) Transcript_16872:669-998(-)
MAGEYSIAPAAAWTLQCANVLFLAAALVEDQLRVRLLLCAAFVMLMAFYASTRAVSLDLIAWSAASIAVHAYRGLRLFKPRDTPDGRCAAPTHDSAPKQSPALERQQLL